MIQRHFPDAVLDFLSTRALLKLQYKLIYGVIEIFLQNMLRWMPKMSVTLQSSEFHRKPVRFASSPNCRSLPNRYIIKIWFHHQHISKKKHSLAYRAPCYQTLHINFDIEKKGRPLFLQQTFWLSVLAFIAQCAADIWAYQTRNFCALSFFVSRRSCGVIAILLIRAIPRDRSSPDTLICGVHGEGLIER